MEFSYELLYRLGCRGVENEHVNGLSRWCWTHLRFSLGRGNEKDMAWRCELGLAMGGRAKEEDGGLLMNEYFMNL